jgi:hypothetical protein
MLLASLCKEKGLRTLSVLQPRSNSAAAATWDAEYAPSRTMLPQTRMSAPQAPYSHLPGVLLKGAPE